MKHIHYILIFAAGLLVASCGNNGKPDPVVFSKKLDKGYAVFYGNYYSAEGINRNVLSLDIYSPTITIDSLGRIGGTGTNVYLSDIFIDTADTLMRRGEYKTDTTYLSYTFLAGIEYENHYSGAYLLNIKDNGYDVTLVKSGTMTLSYSGDSTIIDFSLLLDNANRTVYTGQYRGILPYYIPASQEDAKIIRHNKRVHRLHAARTVVLRQHH